MSERSQNKTAIYEAMMNFSEVCVLLPHTSPEKKDEIVDDIVNQLKVMDHRIQVSLLIAFMAEMACMLARYAHFRGETIEEAVAHWRLDVMEGLHRVEFGADQV